MSLDPEQPVPFSSPGTEHQLSPEQWERPPTQNTHSPGGSGHDSKRVCLPLVVAGQAACLRAAQVGALYLGLRATELKDWEGESRSGRIPPSAWADKQGDGHHPVRLWELCDREQGTLNGAPFLWHGGVTCPFLCLSVLLLLWFAQELRFLTYCSRIGIFSR